MQWPFQAVRSPTSSFLVPQAAVTGMLPGRFAYAERWDEKTDTYLGLAIERAANAAVVIDSESIIIKPEVAEAHRPAPAQPEPSDIPEQPGEKAPGTEEQPLGGVPEPPFTEKKPTRFLGTVMISPERPARDMHQIVEAIVEQLTTLPGSSVKLRLEIDGEVPLGLDRAKVRTLVENANTLGLVQKPWSDGPAGWNLSPKGGRWPIPLRLLGAYFSES